MIEMDIDIDVANRDLVLSQIKHRNALLHSGKQHNTGIYVTEIPHDPLTNTASIDHHDAARRGYFKIDLLNVSIYENIKDDEHLSRLVGAEPDWDMLADCDFVNKLFHLSGHCKLLKRLLPRNLDQLAAVLALIRPAKRYLQNSNWDVIMNEVWIIPDNNEYFFKKAHAYSYAMLVKVHMNLLQETLTT